MTSVTYDKKRWQLRYFELEYGETWMLLNKVILMDTALGYKNSSHSLAISNLVKGQTKC